MCAFHSTSSYTQKLGALLTRSMVTHTHKANLEQEGLEASASEHYFGSNIIRSLVFSMDPTDNIPLSHPHRSSTYFMFLHGPNNGGAATKAAKGPNKMFYAFAALCALLLGYHFVARYILVFVCSWLAGWDRGNGGVHGDSRTWKHKTRTHTHYVKLLVGPCSHHWAAVVLCC